VSGRPRRGRLALGSLMGLAGAALALGLAVVALWPLWYLATRHPSLYTLLVLGAAGAWLVLRFLRKRPGRVRTARPAPDTPLPADVPPADPLPGEDRA